LRPSERFQMAKICRSDTGIRHLPQAQNFILQTSIGLANPAYAHTRQPVQKKANKPHLNSSTIIRYTSYLLKKSP
jgi:hypothetical protein